MPSGVVRDEEPASAISNDQELSAVEHLDGPQGGVPTIPGRRKENPALVSKAAVDPAVGPVGQDEAGGTAAVGPVPRPDHDDPAARLDRDAVKGLPAFAGMLSVAISRGWPRRHDSTLAEALIKRAVGSVPGQCYRGVVQGVFLVADYHDLAVALYRHPLGLSREFRPRRAWVGDFDGTGEAVAAKGGVRRAVPVESGRPEVAEPCVVGQRRRHLAVGSSGEIPDRSSSPACLGGQRHHRDTTLGEGRIGPIGGKCGHAKYPEPE